MSGTSAWQEKSWSPGATWSAPSRTPAGLVRHHRRRFDAFYRREASRPRGVRRSPGGACCRRRHRAGRHARRLPALGHGVGDGCAGGLGSDECAPNRAVSSLRRRGVEVRAVLRLSARRPDEPPPMDGDAAAFWGEVRGPPPPPRPRQSRSSTSYDLGVAEIARTLSCAEKTVEGAPVSLARQRSLTWLGSTVESHSE